MHRLSLAAAAEEPREAGDDETEQKERTGSSTSGTTAQQRTQQQQQQQEGPGDTKKPLNILLVLADDLGTGDIPGYFEDSSKVRTPHLAEMISNGLTFADAHATPLCAPSLYLLLSGNYPHRGKRDFGVWTLGADETQQRSVAHALKENNVSKYHTAMMGKWHLGGKIPPNGYQGDEFQFLLSEPKHNWTLPFGGGPQDIGFDSSLITVGGIQNVPYSFFRDGVLTTKATAQGENNDNNQIVFWDVGRHVMPRGTSVILKSGEGDETWDSSAYNMVLVNETARFLDQHLATRSHDPFFAYVALGAVHIPHTPPDVYVVDDGTGESHPVAGQYPTVFMVRRRIKNEDVVSQSELTLLACTRFVSR